MNTNNSMNLKVWNQASDTFNYQELASNFTTLAEHNHASGQGVQIPKDGIANNAIDGTKLASSSVDYTHLVANSVRTASIQDANVTKSKLDYAGINALTTTTLPSTSIDGYTIQYTNNTTFPSYVWNLRWTAATSSWMFIGGGAIYNYSNNTVSISTASPSWNNSGDYGVISIAVPFTGTYLVHYSGTANTTDYGNYTGKTGFGVAVYANSSIVSGSGVYVNTYVSGATFDNNTATGVTKVTVGGDKAIQLAFNRQAGPSTLNIVQQQMSVVPIKITV